MASGASHIKATYIAIIPTGIATGLALASIPHGIGAAVGCFLGIALTPDLDQISISKSEWKLVKKFGPLGFAWMMYWWLYARIIPHRSFWSHFPIVGTTIRLLYLLTPIIGLCVWRGWIPSTIPQPLLNALIGMFLGLIVSDILHWFMDNCCLL